MKGSIYVEREREKERERERERERDHHMINCCSCDHTGAVVAKTTRQSYSLANNTIYT